MRLTATLVLTFTLGVLTAAEKLPFDAAMKSDVGGRYLLDNAEISIPSIPSSAEDFTALRESIAKDPRGGYAAFITAMIIYGRNKELGLQCMTLMLDQSLLTKGGAKPVYKGYSPDANAQYLIRQIDKYPWLGAVYLDGTSADAGYSLPAKGPFVIRFNQLTRDRDDEVRLYAFTTSGNLPRPMTLKKNDKGIWKALNISSVVVGPSSLPKKVVKDDL
ncbi:MAG: hypothetical protein AABZ39_09770 [Spirochaetota bacterium]